ncbi:MAG: hypothetical protein WKG00_30285 [Polyangiaceae bacterium]
MTRARLPAVGAVFVGALGLAVAAASCSAEQGRMRASGEGIDPRSLPEEVRADYRVYAHRCSKCHSLARSLQSGIQDDAYWARYVQRMKRQPGSGISDADEVIILRFLSFYSAELRRAKAASEREEAAPAPSASDQARRSP